VASRLPAPSASAQTAKLQDSRLLAACKQTPAAQIPSALVKRCKQAFAAGASAAAKNQRDQTLSTLLLVSLIGLGLVTIVSGALGWVVAGRVLAPVRRITETARRASELHLGERLALTGPEDELKELADTFDQLLGRLERSFAFERQFVANASHELRTPLAGMRTSLDVAGAKPGPVPAHFRALADRLGRELDHVERLLESFLTLAHSQQGPASDQATVSLAHLASLAIEQRAEAISKLGLDVEQRQQSEAWVAGSETLLTRIVENVIDNAIGHNQPGGWVRVATALENTHAQLVVENGGPVLDPGQVERLTEPFRRIGAERTGSDKGAGLGLAIVSSIVEAHAGTLTLEAPSGGGLRLAISLPLAPRMNPGTPV
jgi:hypothetical protein